MDDRIDIGEIDIQDRLTGGGDYCFATENADIDELVAGLIRGAFEYQGQKCSALSRAYIPAALWPEVKEKLLAEVATIRVGDPRDFRVLMGAVIDRHAYNQASEYIDDAQKDPEADLLCGSHDAQPVVNTGSLY